MKNYLLLLVLLLSALPAQAGWHTGRVSILAFGYDGVSVSLGIEGYSPTGCTCYSAWGRACLDTTRPNFKNELTMVIAAQAKGTKISVYVDESSCFIKAMAESLSSQ